MSLPPIPSAPLGQSSAAADTTTASSAIQDKPNLLLVEDEDHLRLGLKLNLELEGFTVTAVATARDALAALQATGGDAVSRTDGGGGGSDSGGASASTPLRPDLMILDVMLPDRSGFDLCQAIRRRGNYVPILMLTARSAATDRVRGLDAGADDYIPKPFDLNELIARVRSLLRRRTWEHATSPVPADSSRPASDLRPTTDGLDAQATATALPTALPRFVQVGQHVVLDRHTHQVTRQNQTQAAAKGAPNLITLTRLELDLVCYFVGHPQRVLTREELLRNVWQLANAPSTRTVDTFVARLRKYFEDNPAKPAHFISARGSGYRYMPPEASAASTSEAPSNDATPQSNAAFA